MLPRFNEKMEPTTMKQELPFTRQNRPWMTPDCIEAMNEQFMVCLSHLPDEIREDLRKWAAIKVEVGYCVEHPKVMDDCFRHGEHWAEEFRRTGHKPDGG
jgi:hypothetical protein